MRSRISGGDHCAFTIYKVPVDVPTLTYSQAAEVISGKIHESCEKSTINSRPEALRVANKIAFKTARAPGNCSTGNIVAYKGSSEYDAGILVAHDKSTNLYSVAFPEGWENYYMVIEK